MYIKRLSDQSTMQMLPHTIAVEFIHRFSFNFPFSRQFRSSCLMQHKGDAAPIFICSYWIYLP